VRLLVHAAFLMLAAFAMVPMASAPATAASYAGIVVDAKTGKVLYGHREDARQAPASLTKMMTLYMLFEAMQAGKVSKKTRIKVSKHAASMAPSKLGIKAGGSVSAEQAILALVTKSANDVAAAVGEHLGGTESAFAKMMTAKARALGMDSTVFRNASGLPASGQLTTARDMARLGVALREHFPQYYGYFATRVFTYGKARMGNHNRLLGVVKGMDGIKTGYTRASGFNLVSSVERDGRSIVAVVLGGKSGKSRNEQMRTIIDKHIGKASRGGDKLIVAKPRGSIFKDGGGEETEVASAPMPEKRPVEIATLSNEDPVEQRIATAHVVSEIAFQQAVESEGRSFDVAAIEAKLRSMSKDRLPVPSPAPSAGTTDPIVTAAAQTLGEQAQQLGYAHEEAPAKAAQMAEKLAQGWQIQIGATPSQDQAEALLERARSTAGNVLADVDNHMETVEKNGETLYRARFAGFDSKDDAWAACNRLKKKKFACIAIAN
jgi:D-alanyl-D-alanine carboxypeptidase